MPEKFKGEQPVYSEEQLSQEKSRAIETAGLLKKGAEFKQSPEGNLYLDVPEEVIESIARDYKIKKENIEYRQKQKEETDQRRAQWEADQEELKEFNQRPETVREHEAVHQAIETYFSEAKRDDTNLAELGKNLSEEDRTVLQMATAGLKDLRGSIESISHFDCCFGDDRHSLIQRTVPPKFNWEQQSKFVHIIDKLLHQPVLKLESADDETKKKIDAVTLDNVLSVWESAVTKSAYGSSKGEGWVKPEILGLYPSGSMGREEGRRTTLERISIRLSKELGLGAAEVYRELGKRLVGKFPERATGTPGKAFQSMRENVEKDYREFLKALDLEPTD